MLIWRRKKVFTWIFLCGSQLCISYGLITLNKKKSYDDGNPPSIYTFKFKHLMLDLVTSYFQWQDIFSQTTLDWLSINNVIANSLSKKLASSVSRFYTLLEYFSTTIKILHSNTWELSIVMIMKCGCVCSPGQNGVSWVLGYATGQQCIKLCVGQLWRAG